MRNAKGFLLLEVILAMVMVASGLLFVCRVYYAAKGAMERSQALFISSLLLEQKIFDLESCGAEYDAGRVEFTENRGCYWEVRAGAIDEESPEFLKITLGVFLPPRKSFPDAYWLQTYLMKKRAEKST